MKESKGILSGFANHSYAKIKASFNPQKKPFEIVVTFETGNAIDSTAGILCSAIKYGASPFLVRGGQVECFMSSNGVSWDIAQGVATGVMLKPKTLYNMMIKYDGNLFAFYLRKDATWMKLKEFPSTGANVFGNADLQFGVARPLTMPFSGQIDLNGCYICVAGNVLWEGVKGAYKNLNR